MTFEPGDLIGVPLANGRFAVLWLLEAGTFTTLNQRTLKRTRPRERRTFLEFEAFFDQLPAREHLPRKPSIADGTFADRNGGRRDVLKGWFQGPWPKDFLRIGNAPLSASAKAHTGEEGASGTSVYQDGEHLRTSLGDRWRLVHDKEAYFAELEAATRAREERAAARRASLTLEEMAKERPFATWSERWSARDLREARRIFKDATLELIALGPRAPKAKRVAVLKRITTELNALDDPTGCIETVEREELVARIEELAARVGLANDDEVLTGHRDW